MNILSTEFKVSNVKKPSNKKWKLIADWLLYTMPAYSLLIISSPLPEKFRLWANFLVGTMVITLKGISKFTSEPIPEPATVEYQEDENTLGQDTK